MDDKAAFTELARSVRNSNSLWASEEFGAAFPGLFQRVVSFLVAAVPDNAELEFLDSDVDIDGRAVEIVAFTDKVLVYLYFDDDNGASTRAWRRSEIKELIVVSAPIVNNDPSIAEQALMIRAIYADSNGDSHHSFPMQAGNHAQSDKIGALYRSLFADLADG